MARIRDWVGLAQLTVRSLQRRDVADLVSLEWPEARRRLVEQYAEEIESEPRRLHRWYRLSSALLYGIFERLAPQRRLLLGAAALAFGMSIVALALQESWQEPTLLIYAGLCAGFLGLTVLLGMELIDKLKFRDELVVARELQAQLVPQHLPETPEWDVAAFNHVANMVGGDLYDFVPLGNGRMAVLFGDASGHGMAAGLIMAVAHAAFRTQLRVDPLPGPMFDALNRVLCHTGNRRSFFAAAYVVLDADGRWEAAVAGHPPPMRLATDGSLIEEIGRGSYPLGIRDQGTWEVERGVLAPGETLVFHSDGLMESRDANGVAFGDARIASVCRWASQGTSRSMIDTLVRHWREFSTGTVPEDDVSVGAIRRRVAGPASGA